MELLVSSAARLRFGGARVTGECPQAEQSVVRQVSPPLICCAAAGEGCVCTPNAWKRWGRNTGGAGGHLQAPARTGHALQQGTLRRHRDTRVFAGA